MKRALTALVVLLSAFAVAQQTQQTAPMLSISVGARNVSISPSDWASLSKTSVRATNGHDNKTAVYSGVLLRELLQKVGVPSGEALRGKDMATYVRVNAKDGYAVLFTLPELDKSFRDEDVLVADQKDGKPIDSDKGPLQVIVPNDKRPGRWIRMVTNIEVVNLRSSDKPQVTQ